MHEFTRPIADGKVLWHFSMSLDGFIAGPGHSMDWLDGLSDQPGLIEPYVETLGAVLAGRDGYDMFGHAKPYGNWDGPIFVLTHHPEDATPGPDVTFLDCDAAEAVRIARDAAGGKNVEVHSASIGRQLLGLGLIDEIDLHIAPVLLGDGIRLYDNPGGKPVRLHATLQDDPLAELNVRYRPIR
jgi:dihydrofolate reductase